MPRSGKVRRVYDNDDAWIMAETKPPLTPDIMWWNMIEPHEGSPVDGWLYSVGGHDVYDYETDIGERTSEAYAERGDRRQRNRGDNLRHMIEHHGGPMSVMTEQCHRLGMDFLPSVRMNEHYDIDPDDPAFGKLRREHPEFTIGKGKDLPEPSMEWGVGTGLDYALPEVRDYMSSIVLESVERWDVEGVELDFFRHPTHFNIEEAYSNRYLMTDMVEKIRRRMDEIGEARGKGLDLMVRVPATIERCERLGLDIREWVDSYLVDVVVAGGGFIPFEMPIKEFVDLAEGTETLIYGCLEAYRPAVDELTLRAIAARYWDAGVDGLYLFNFYSMPQEWKRRVLGDLIDRDGLRRMDKRYETDDRTRFVPTSHLHLTFLNAIPRAQLPVTLRKTSTGSGVKVAMDMPESFRDAHTTLGLRFGGLAENDVIEVAVNGLALSDAPAKGDGWTHVFYEEGWNKYPSETKTEELPGETLDYDLASTMLQRGMNTVEVKLVSEDPARNDDLELQQIRVEVRYE